MINDSITYFGILPVYGLPLEALDIVNGALDAIAYVSDTLHAPAADDALAPDEETAIAEAAIAAEIYYHARN